MTLRLLFFIIIIGVSSCLNKKCNETFDLARYNTKDTALMYIWRYTDNLIRPDKLDPDSGYLSFKPNGDYCWDYKRQGLVYANVWYTKKDTVFELRCRDYSSSEVYRKYKILNDTLFIFGNVGDGTFSNTAITYKRVLKY